MGLLTHKIRVLIRSFGTPMSRRVAEKWHFRTLILYNISAACLCGAVLYFTYATKDQPSNSNFGEIWTAQDLAKRFGRSDSTTVITVSGFQSPKTEVINKCEDESESSEDTYS